MATPKNPLQNCTDHLRPCTPQAGRLLAPKSSNVQDDEQHFPSTTNKPVTSARTPQAGKVTREDHFPWSRKLKFQYFGRMHSNQPHKDPNSYFHYAVVLGAPTAQNIGQDVDAIPNNISLSMYTRCLPNTQKYYLSTTNSKYETHPRNNVKYDNHRFVHSIHSAEHSVFALYQTNGQTWILRARSNTSSGCFLTCSRHCKGDSRRAFKCGQNTASENIPKIPRAVITKKSQNASKTQP